VTSTPARPWSPPRWAWPVVLVASLAPAAWGAYAFISDWKRGTVLLGAEPVKELEHYLGDWTLRFLVITLAITPIRRTSKWNWVQKYRRRFGLIAFTYASLHLLTYALIDVQIDWSVMIEDVTKRWYITIGMTAFLMMLALAVTSTAGSIKRLGKKWVKLHQLVYAIAILGTIHFWMSVKKDIREPLTYALIFAALLGYRVWLSQRSRLQHPVSKPSPRTSSAHSG
jgi:sulfoxide reductase heme-binding subunit YedZ